jgi:hypothetical protein
MKLAPELLARKPLELSGWSAAALRRWRALVKEAGLVLLDEPLANLITSCAKKCRDPKIFEEAGSICPCDDRTRRSAAAGGNTGHDVGRITTWEDADCTANLLTRPPRGCFLIRR